MSNEHSEHQSGIKTPKQLIVAVLAGFLVPIITIVLIVQYVTSNKVVGVGSGGQSPEAIAERLAPVADQGFTFRDASAPRVLQTGEQVYKTTCMACHDTGAAGAPKTGDNAAWGPKIAAGYETLLKNAINGVRAMPAKGGNPDLDDVEVARAVVYMANKSGASFKEPEVKAAPAAAEPAATPVPGTAGTAVETPATSPAPAAAAAAPAAAPAKVATADGKKVYDASCAACHNAGVTGAPKPGDKANWAPRIAQGNEVLYAHAIKGFQGKTGFMPPKGGSSASDAEVKAAVDYMTASAK